MKLIADPIILPDDADWQTIEDAKIKANWHRVITKEERMAQTDLCLKCGSCIHFDPTKSTFTESWGKCDFKTGSAALKARTTPCCGKYEKKG